MLHKHRWFWFAATLSTTLGLVGERGALGQHPDASRPADRAVQVLVVYDSLMGNTEQMAQAVAKGVRRVAGAAVVVKKIDQLGRDDLVAADGIVIGAPTYYGNIPGKMKAAMDLWSWKWKVDLTDKAGGAFATGGGQMGGKEHVAVSLLLFMINNRMVVAGPLYEDAEGDDGWAEIGAGAMTGPLDPRVGEQELDSAHRLGERIARLAVRMRQGAPQAE